MMADQKKAMHAIVVGGGIGGLVAALCLAAKQCDVTLLEQAPDFSEAGAGIQLSPNCVRVLHHLGLESGLNKIGFLPEATQFRHWQRGRVISESPLGESAKARYGAPYYHVHRGDLLLLLADSAAASARIRLVSDCRVTGFEQLHGGVQVYAGEQLAYDGDLVVGADGIHSTLRTLLWGDEPARFTGNVAWRALVPAAQLPGDMILPNSTVWWGPGKHFVHYYVRGGELVNCVCVVEKEGWEVESWTEPGDVAELRADFSGWHQNIQTLIDNVEETSLFKWALFDRKPMSAWSRGRVTLLGDACHPTLPFMAQGAAMAIEDSAVLANCLSAEDDVERALQRYESLRKARTANIQKGSRRNASVFHMSGVKAFFRDLAVTAAGSRTMDKLYRYDPLSQL